MSRRERSTRVVADAAALPRAFEPARVVADPAEEAYRRGLREGAERAAAEAEARCAAGLDEMRAELAGALATLGDLRRRLTRDHEQTMIELALAAASVVVRERIAADDPVAARAVRDALDAVPSGDDTLVRLHPDDVGGVERALATAGADGGVTIRADDAVARGGCVVSTAAGTVDARLETALDAVADAARGGSDAS